MFGRKKTPPSRKTYWSVRHAIEKVGRDPRYPSLDQHAQMVVFLIGPKYDARYPALTRNQRIDVGHCDPTDTDKISDLIVEAADKVTSLQDALDYAARAERAVA